MNDTLKNHLLAVAKTLGDVEICGKDNMVKVLASIQHLESIANGELGEYVLKEKEVNE